MDLPAWNDRNAHRARKAHLAGIGKRRAFAALAPIVLEILVDVDTRHLGDPAQLVRVGDPRQHADAARQAIEELRAGTPSAGLAQLAVSRAWGLVRAARVRLDAAYALIDARSARTQVEVGVMSALSGLAAVSPELLARARLARARA
jgi:hypothetical protein